MTILFKKNYEIIKKHLNDKLLLLKLAFFSTIAHDIETFLREFQTDQPMLPFLYTNFRVLVYNLLERFIKSEVLESENYWNIDLIKKDNLLQISKMNLGYTTRSALTKCKALTQRNHSKF